MEYKILKKQVFKFDMYSLVPIREKDLFPIIVSGGAGNYQDLFKAISYGHASAVAAASVFHFTEQTPFEAKKFLASKGIPVRNTNIY